MRFEQVDDGLCGEEETGIADLDDIIQLEEKEKRERLTSESMGCL